MFETQIVDKIEDVITLLDYLTSSPSQYLAFDVETNSKFEKRAELFGLGLCSEDHESFYIPFRTNKNISWWSPNELEQIIDRASSLLSSKKLLAHNGVYDLLVLKNNWGVDFTEYLYADTILMKHMIDEESPFALKEIAVTYLGDWANKAEQELEQNVKKNGGRYTKEEKDMWKADTDILGVYCAWDVQLTLRLFHYFTPLLKNQGLEDLFYKDETMPLYKEVTIPMKDKGFPIDIKHFEDLKVRIKVDIDRLEDKIQKDISEYIKEFEQTVLEKEVPARKSGHFPKYYAETTNTILPITKDGRVTLAAKELLKVPKSLLIDWIMDDLENIKLDKDQVLATQKAIFFTRYPEDKYIFNLNSSQHLAWLFFNKLGINPIEFTPNGAPKMDADTLELLAGEHEFVDSILEYKKLQKLLSTYIEGILSRQIDGVIYTSMLQFGTTSGRFASRDPNLNNLPALKDEDDDSITELVKTYTNAIRAGLVAAPGDKAIGSDWSSLEPTIASYMTQDFILMDTFITGKDFYSVIGINQFNIKDASPFNDGSKDSFAIKYKTIRKRIKQYSLASFYGAGAYRIAEVLECSKEEAQQLLDGYFNTFPGVKKFIDETHTEAIRYGFVKTKFGRVRHLPEVKRLHSTYGYKLLDYKWANKNGLKKERSKLKNLLNNAVNFKIQGLAAHGLNRGMLLTTRKFKEYNINARVALPIHDEILVLAKEADVTRAKEVLKWSMENCIDISPIKLKANPIVGRSYAECK